MSNKTYICKAVAELDCKMYFPGGRCSLPESDNRLADNPNWTLVKPVEVVEKPKPVSKPERSSSKTGGKGKSII